MKWRLPQDADGGPEVLVRVDGSSRILQLLGATWRSSGRYTCEEPSADQSRTVDVFIPGQGNGPQQVLEQKTWWGFRVSRTTLIQSEPL